MTDGFAPDFDQRQTIGGREFHIQIEMEWISHEEMWDFQPVRLAGVDRIGRAKEVRRFIDGESVCEERFEDEFAQAIRFSRLVGEVLKPPQTIAPP